MNKVEYSPNDFKNNAALIMQNDYLLESLTVRGLKYLNNKYKLLLLQIKIITFFKMIFFLETI